MYHKNGEGAIIPPLSVLKMRVEKVPLCTINFASKTNRHHQLDSWAETILAQPGMKKKFNDLGIMRAIP